MTRPVARGIYPRRCARCGWEGVYDTAAKAEAGKRRHSCQRRLAAAARAAEREARVDRTPKPCLHKIANHEHGTRACYCLDKCRCLPCTKANAAATNERARRKAYGRYDKYVDADPIREHLAALAAYGIGLKQVSKLSGVSTGALSKIVFGLYAETGRGAERRHGEGELVRGPSRRVLRTTADRIYAVRATPANLGAHRPDYERTPVARLHLRALAALGWSQSRLADRLGMKGSNFTRLITGDQPMYREHVDQVEALYAALSMTLPAPANRFEQGGITRAKSYAKARGWLPPLALEVVAEVPDVDTMSDLDEQAIFRRMHGDKTVRLTKAERRELVARLHAQGLTDAQIEALTQIADDTVMRDRHYLGLPPNERADKHVISTEWNTARGRARRQRDREAS